MTTRKQDQIIDELYGVVQGGPWSDPARLSPLERALRIISELDHDLADTEDLYDRLVEKFHDMRDDRDALQRQLDRHLAASPVPAVKDTEQHMAVESISNIGDTARRWRLTLAGYELPIYMSDQQLAAAGITPPTPAPNCCPTCDSTYRPFRVWTNENLTQLCDDPWHTEPEGLTP